MEVNESPVFLRLDPKRDAAQKDLPVYLYESGEHPRWPWQPPWLPFVHGQPQRVAGGNLPEQGWAGMRGSRTERLGAASPCVALPL